MRLRFWKDPESHEAACSRPKKLPIEVHFNENKQETTKFFKRHHLFKTTYLLCSNLIKTQVNLEFSVNCLSSTML